MALVFKNFTTEDCLSILKKEFNSTDFTITSFKFCSLGENVGYLGTHHYLKIYYEEDGENKFLRCFAKAMPSLDEHKTFLEESGAFSKEVAFFRRLEPDMLDNGIDVLKGSIPRCYLMCDKKYIIFEDLQLQGYKMIETRQCISLDCIKISLDVLAKFHCSGLIFEEKMKEKTGEAFRLNEKYPEVLEESFFPYKESSHKFLAATKSGAKAVINLLEDESNVNVELFKQLTDEVYDNFREIVKPSTRFRNTICHSDLWVGNFMYKFENEKPVHSYILDFQMQRYAPPAQDLMTFFHLATNQKFRQEHMEFLINYYYEKVTLILKGYNLCAEKVLPYAEFIESCDYYKIFGICLTINHHQLIMVPPEDMDTMFKETLQDVMFGDRTEHIERFCAKSDAYKKKSFENIIDLKEAFIEKGKL